MKIPCPIEARHGNAVPCTLSPRTRHGIPIPCLLHFLLEARHGNAVPFTLVFPLTPDHNIYMPVFHYTIHAYRSWNTDHPKGWVQRHEPGIRPPNKAIARHRNKIACFPPVVFTHE